MISLSLLPTNAQQARAELGRVGNKFPTILGDTWSPLIRQGASSYQGHSAELGLVDYRGWSPAQPRLRATAGSIGRNLRGCFEGGRSARAAHPRQRRRHWSVAASQASGAPSSQGTGWRSGVELRRQPGRRPSTRVQVGLPKEACGAQRPRSPRLATAPQFELARTGTKVQLLVDRHLQAEIGGRAGTRPGPRNTQTNLGDIGPNISSR